MNANSKKLLSLLIVVAMVLAMTPVISLPAEAADDFNPTGFVCEHCGGEAKVWTELTTTYTSAVTVTTGGHYYLADHLSGSDGTSTSKGMLNIASDIDVCLYAGSYQIKNSRSGDKVSTKGFAIRVSGGGTLNYMGTGNISGYALSSNGAALYVENGTVNLYGGKLINRNGDTDTTNGDGFYAVRVGASGGTVTMHEGVEIADKIFLYGTAGDTNKVATLNITGGTYTNPAGIVPYETGNTSVSVTGGTFSFNPSAYVADGYAPTDNGDGTWTVAEGQAAAFTRDCEHCNEKDVEWKELTGGSTQITLTESGHYYLSDGLSGGTSGMLTIASDIEVCLYSKYQIKNSRGAASGTKGIAVSVSGGGTLNYMGTGTISGIADSSYGAAITVENGTVNLYGGTLINRNGDDDEAGTNGDSYYVVRVGASGGTVTMHEGVETADKIFLYGTADDTTTEADETKVAALNITGGTYTNPAGIVPYETGNTAVSVTGGTFSFDPKEYVPETHIANDNGNGTWTVNTYTAPDLPTTCPMCQQENVEWTAVTAVGTLTTGHYYLKYSLESENKYTVTVEADNAVCLNLNGENIKNTGNNNGPVALYANGGTLRVNGTGVVSTPNVTPDAETGKVSWGTVLSKGETAVVEIYGGTYIDGDARDNAVRSTGSLTVYGGTFSSKPSAGFVADGKWALPDAGKWTVDALKPAAIITATGYQLCDTTADALTNYDITTKDSYILIGSANSIELTKDAYVDNNGKAVAVTGSGKLYAMDSSNDDYSGNGSWTVTDADIQRDVTNPVTSRRYINVTRDGVTTSYRLELHMTKVVLRANPDPEELGMYYKAQISCSDELKGLMEGYGAIFDLTTPPTQENCTTAETSMYTAMDADTLTLVNNSAEVNTAFIANILVEGNGDGENSAKGKSAIYGAGYIAIDLEGKSELAFILSDNTADLSLYDTMDKFDVENPNPLVESLFKALKTTFGIADWEFNYIGKEE